MNLVAPANFSGLGELFNDFTKARTQSRVNEAMRLADLSNPESLLQTGQSLARAGDLQTGLSLANLGRQMQTEQRQREAGQQFNQMLGGILGGGMQPNAAPPVQRAPTNQSASLGNGPLPASLIQNESGGRFDARNDAVGSGGQVGHFGRAQFGQARLQDAMAAGAIPQGTTPEQFMANPQMQQAAEAWHVNDLNRQIEARGLTRFEGQIINGAPVTRQGILAGAHLGGIGGVTRYLASGGQFNPADANGTRIGDYVARHGGGGQQVAQAGGMPQQPAQGGFDPSRLQQAMPMLIQAMGNPDLPAAQRQQIQTLIQMGAQQQGSQIIQREDGVFMVNPRTGQSTRIMEGTPRAPVTLSAGQRLVDPRTGQQIGNDAPPGYRPLTDPQERARFGISPNDTRPYQVGPDNRLLSPNAQTPPNPESTFERETAKTQAEMFGEELKLGNDARVNIGLIGELRRLSDRIGTGIGAVIQQQAGRVGINLPGTGEVQAFEALVDRLTPQQRVAGSGATSDFDARMFKSSLPSLMRSPEGNRLIMDTMEALARHNLERAQIAGRVMSGELNRNDGLRAMQGLADPLAGFRAWRETNSNRQGAAPTVGSSGATMQPASGNGARIISVEPVR
jgi:hypothetical protein